MAAFGPRDINHDLTRRRVGHWLNIVSAPQKRDWLDVARGIAAPLLLDWHEQGWIDSASQNHISRLPHQDFYKLMSERCGAVEHRPVPACQGAMWRIVNGGRRTPLWGLDPFDLPGLPA